MDEWVNVGGEYDTYQCGRCKAHFEVEHLGSPAKSPGVNFCPNCGYEL